MPTETHLATGDSRSVQPVIRWDVDFNPSDPSLVTLTAALLDRHTQETDSNPLLSTTNLVLRMDKEVAHQLYEDLHTLGVELGWQRP